MSRPVIEKSSGNNLNVFRNHRVRIVAMSKRKAESLAVSESGLKKPKHESKPFFGKQNLLDDSDGSSSEDESVGGAPVGEAGFKINKEFANRFEHNKKREELSKCGYPTYSVETFTNILYSRREIQ